MSASARRDDHASFTAFAILVTALALFCGASVFVILTELDARSTAPVIATTLATPLALGASAIIIGRLVGRVSTGTVSASTR
ncbi:MAG: hypothetical protein KY455_12155 [Euryarchaeota archaeon]|nr:hypothetical protein [Euryarchaeota archaeon]